MRSWTTHQPGATKGAADVPARGTVDSGTPVVAVWRDRWLPASETFIRDHVRSLSRWRPLLLGLGRVPNGLDVQPDWAPFASTGPRRLAERAARRMGYRGVYDWVLARHRPSLVHAHFGTNALEILPVARRRGLPLVVTFHGHDLTTALRGPGGDRYRAQLPELWRYASLLLPVSDELERRLLALGAPTHKVRRHYLGVDLRASPPAISAARHGILYVGRLIPQKGVSDLIDAVAALPEPLRRSTPVTVIGDGPERGGLQERAAAVDDAQFRFLGRQPPEVVADELTRAAVLCCPSRASRPGDTEAFGQVYLEAARAGVPAVGYRFGGVVEAVVHGETGLLAAEGDVPGLSRLLQAVLEDPALARRLGEAGRNRVSAEFDLRARTADLELLYDQVALAAAPGRRAG